VTRLARRLFAAHAERFTKPDGISPDPFDSRGTFAQFARARHLVKGTVKPEKATWNEFNPKDNRVGAVHRMFQLALRTLGPHRYELLMRYLSHICVLRNQSAFLRDPDWPETPAAKRP
jgi:hypothetical protein